MVGSGPGGGEGDRPATKPLGKAEHTPQETGHMFVNLVPYLEWVHKPMLAMIEHVHAKGEYLVGLSPRPAQPQLVDPRRQRQPLGPFARSSQLRSFVPDCTPSARPHASKPDEFWLCISPALGNMRNIAWPPGTSMCPEFAPHELTHCQYLVPSLRAPQPKQATAWPPPLPVSFASLPMYTPPRRRVPSRSCRLKLARTLKEQVNAP